MESWNDYIIALTQLIILARGILFHLIVSSETDGPTQPYFLLINETNERTNESEHSDLMKWFHPTENGKKIVFRSSPYNANDNISICSITYDRLSTESYLRLLNIYMFIGRFSRFSAMHRMCMVCSRLMPTHIARMPTQQRSVFRESVVLARLRIPRVPSSSTRTSIYLHRPSEKKQMCRFYVLRAQHVFVSLFAIQTAYQIKLTI